MLNKPYILKTIFILFFVFAETTLLPTYKPHQHNYGIFGDSVSDIFRLFVKSQDSEREEMVQKNLESFKFREQITYHLETVKYGLCDLSDRFVYFHLHVKRKQCN